MDGMLAPRILKKLETSLRASFDLTDSGPCSRLKSYIENLITAKCEALEDELLRKTAEAIDGKTFEDWRSWYLEETMNLQAHTIGNFADRIIDIETLSASANQKVPCDLGYKHADEFRHCWQNAWRTRQADLSLVPLSKHHQIKKRDRTWAPYLSDAFKSL